MCLVSLHARVGHLGSTERNLRLATLLNDTEQQHTCKLEHSVPVPGLQYTAYSLYTEWG